MLRKRGELSHQTTQPRSMGTRGTPARTTAATGAHTLPRLETGNTSTPTRQPLKLLDDPGQLFTPPPRPLWHRLHIRSIYGTLYP